MINGGSIVVPTLNAADRLLSLAAQLYKQPVVSNKTQVASTPSNDKVVKLDKDFDDVASNVADYAASKHETICHNSLLDIAEEFAYCQPNNVIPIKAHSRELFSPSFFFSAYLTQVIAELSQTGNCNITAYGQGKFQAIKIYTEKASTHIDAKTFFGIFGATFLKRDGK